MTLRYTLRPISDRAGLTGPAVLGDRNPFRGTWTSTLKMLERELECLEARHVVLELDIRERDIRLDGALRADARVASSPAARLAFDTPAGPMQFATDRYGWRYDGQPYADGWQQNVRAIALGLESLRRVDRYGITRLQEQYRGFLAIESGNGTAPSGMTTDLALEVIARESGRAIGYVAEDVGACVKLARRNAHPDVNAGDESRWRGVDEAVQVLTRSGRL